MKQPLLLVIVALSVFIGQPTRSDAQGTAAPSLDERAKAMIDGLTVACYLIEQSSRGEQQPRSAECWSTLSNLQQASAACDEECQAGTENESYLLLEGWIWLAISWLDTLLDSIGVRI